MALTPATVARSTRGRHRGVNIPDLVPAAIAGIEQLTVLHHDAYFDLIAEVTGQPTEWVGPRGTVNWSGPVPARHHVARPHVSRI